MSVAEYVEQNHRALLERVNASKQAEKKAMIEFYHEHPDAQTPEPLQGLRRSEWYRPENVKEWWRWVRGQIRQHILEKDEEQAARVQEIVDSGDDVNNRIFKLFKKDFKAAKKTLGEDEIALIYITDQRSKRADRESKKWELLRYYSWTDNDRASPLEFVKKVISNRAAYAPVDGLPRWRIVNVSIADQYKQAIRTSPTDWNCFLKILRENMQRPPRLLESLNRRYKDGIPYCDIPQVVKKLQINVRLVNISGTEMKYCPGANEEHSKTITVAIHDGHAIDAQVVPPQPSPLQGWESKEHEIVEYDVLDRLHTENVDWPQIELSGDYVLCTPTKIYKTYIPIVHKQAISMASEAKMIFASGTKLPMPTFEADIFSALWKAAPRPVIEQYNFKTAEHHQYDMCYSYRSSVWCQQTRFPSGHYEKYRVGPKQQARALKLIEEYEGCSLIEIKQALPPHLALIFPDTNYWYYHNKVRLLIEEKISFTVKAVLFCRKSLPHTDVFPRFFQEKNNNAFFNSLIGVMKMKPSIRTVQSSNINDILATVALCVEKKYAIRDLELPGTYYGADEDSRYPMKVSYSINTYELAAQRSRRPDVYGYVISAQQVLFAKKLKEVHNAKLWQSIVALRVDSITLNKQCDDLFHLITSDKKKSLNFARVVGKWQKEKCKSSEAHLEMEQNVRCEDDIATTNWLPLTKSVVDVEIEGERYEWQNMLLEGPGGCGKTYCIKQAAQKLDNVCFVGSTNLASQNLDETAKTIHNVLGYVYDEKKREWVFAEWKKDRRPYSVIVWDEAFCLPALFLDKLIELQPYAVVVLVGDRRQQKCIGTPLFNSPHFRRFRAVDFTNNYRFKDRKMIALNEYLRLAVGSDADTGETMKPLAKIAAMEPFIETLISTFNLRLATSQDVVETCRTVLCPENQQVSLWNEFYDSFASEPKPIIYNRNDKNAKNGMQGTLRKGKLRFGSNVVVATTKNYQLAYAMTIHKSQGRTISQPYIVDLTNVKCIQDLYVACSRGERFEQLHFVWRRQAADQLRNVVRNHIRGIEQADVGLDYRKFKKYITSLFEEGMSWRLLVNGKITIDHNIPIAILHTDCNYWSNLRPMWKSDNSAKHVKLDLGHYDEYQRS
jgi:hypothetical protein